MVRSGLSHGWICQPTTEIKPEFKQEFGHSPECNVQACRRQGSIEVDVSSFQRCATDAGRGYTLAVAERLPRVPHAKFTQRNPIGDFKLCQAVSLKRLPCCIWPVKHPEAWDTFVFARRTWSWCLLVCPQKFASQWGNFKNWLASCAFLFPLVSLSQSQTQRGTRGAASQLAGARRV